MDFRVEVHQLCPCLKSIALRLVGLSIVLVDGIGGSQISYHRKMCFLVIACLFCQT